MRRGLSLALWAATVALQTLALEAQGRVLVERGDEWRFLKGNVEPPTDWAAPLFDDSSWFHGPTGIGYGDNDDATVLDDMQCNYIAFFARRAFSVEDLASVQTLVLSIDYDDAFAAYLNGSEVARRGLGPPGARIAFDQPADTDHEAGTPEFMLLDLQLLRQGMNVLAFEVHNDELDSSDASFIPRLVANGSFPPSDVTCAREESVAKVQWVSHGNYESEEIERNGVGIGTIPGTATEFIDASPVGLDSVYRVVVLADGADIKSTNDCFLPCSAHALSCGLALQGGVTQGTLSWTPISDGPGILTFVFRNGALLKSLQKGETAFLDPDVESRNPLSAVEYRVVESAPEIGSCTLRCSASLCPKDLNATVTTRGRVELTWGNLVKAWDHFEISRDGAVIDASVAGSATSWMDPSVLVANGNYNYLLHPVAAPPGQLPDPATQCDQRFTLQYAGGNGPSFRRGDADGSGALNITDGVFILNFLFSGGRAPDCMEAADADDSGSLTITDAIRVLNFLFLGGQDIPAPGPFACGEDPTAPDNLEACVYSRC